MTYVDATLAPLRKTGQIKIHGPAAFEGMRKAGQLAARCLDKGARVLGPKGHPFTENDIGSALAVRSLMDELRQGGKLTGGPAPMTPKDRSRFLSKLDEMIHAVRRDHAKSSEAGRPR